MAEVTNSLCLNLLCPLSSEERLVDALLSIGDVGIFASTPAFAHGFSHGELNTEEQVSGRSGAALVQVLVAADKLDALLAQLQPELAHVGVRYWATAVARQGEFE